MIFGLRLVTGCWHLESLLSHSALLRTTMIVFSFQKGKRELQTCQICYEVEDE
jgi:hypothetical protein